jgi:hypothetical protein
MALDPDLLARARTAGAALDEAERSLLVARADYHTAIRRLHLGGASLREVAVALSISHQRVQQIVNVAGGTWWSRVWRTRTPRPDAVCTWCGRPPGEVAKLIAGPHVYVCDSCAEAAERAAAGDDSAGPFSAAAGRRSGMRCAFCGKRASKARSLVAAPEGHICSDCLRVCREILG